MYRGAYLPSPLICVTRSVAASSRPGAAQRLPLQEARRGEVCINPFVLLEIPVLPGGFACPQELKQNSVADVSKRSVSLVIKITFLPIT